MPCGLPDQSHRSLTHEKPEEDSDSYRQFLNPVPVDVDIDEQANQRSSTDKTCPIPLPTSSNGNKPLCLRQIRLAMFREKCQSEDQRNTIHGGEANACITTRSDIFDGYIAFRSIDETAIVEEESGLIGLKCQPALRTIGESPITVVGIVEVFKSGEVEVNISKDGIGFVVAFWPREEVSGVEDFGLVSAHCSDLMRCGYSSSL